MSQQHVHIVMHDVPYPADFGGVVDLFYKLKWLHHYGVQIHLHCFVNKRPPQNILNTFCATVHYYPRKKLGGLSLQLPYIVASRRSKALLHNLMQDDYPVLLEGIHCCYELYKNNLPNKRILLRLHNVEFAYYKQLAIHEKNVFKKIYYQMEARLLQRFEATIAAKAHKILTVSEDDVVTYQQHFKVNNCTFLPVFLPHQQVDSMVGKGKYWLYHGNLSVNENEVAAAWLIKNVAPQTILPFIIAGKNPSTYLKNLVKANSNITLVESPTTAHLHQLIQEAHINVLPSFNNTGVKLKLLNALYNGRFCLVNHAGTAGSGLDALCNIATDTNSFITTINELSKQTFSENEKQHRSAALNNLYNNAMNAQAFVKMLL